MADPFSFREVGDPAAVGSKYGSAAGHQTRVIYPEQKLTRGEFRSGRVLSWKWNSDGMAAWKPRDTRLFVEYRIACGEVTETATSSTVGARTGQANAGVPAAPSLRMACLCNTALFDSGLRFIHNGVTIENIPSAYTVAMAMVLLAPCALRIMHDARFARLETRISPLLKPGSRGEAWSCCANCNQPW